MQFVLTPSTSHKEEKEEGHGQTSFNLFLPSAVKWSSIKQCYSYDGSQYM